MNISEYRRYAHQYFVLDGAVPRGTMGEWIANALYPIPSAHCEVSFHDESVHIPCDPSAVLPSLPPSYGVKGGAARVTLQHFLYPEQPVIIPRDIDIIRYRGKASTLDWQLAEKYMPEDALQGRGVEHVTSLPRYLQTRDITVNELVVIGTTLSISFRGLLDTRARILRPSRYRGGSLHAAKNVGGLTLAKMFRLKVEAEARGEEWEIVGIPEQQTLSSFDVAIHLDRALGAGTSIAHAYIEELRRERFLPDDDSTLEAWIEYLAHELPEGYAFFRNLPHELRSRVHRKDESL